MEDVAEIKGSTRFNYGLTGNWRGSTHGRLNRDVRRKIIQLALGRHHAQSSQH